METVRHFDDAIQHRQFYIEITQMEKIKMLTKQTKTVERREEKYSMQHSKMTIQGNTIHMHI